MAAVWRPDGGGASAAHPFLAELEERLLHIAWFNSRLQRALLRHSVFSAIEAKLGDPAMGEGDSAGGCTRERRDEMAATQK